MSEERVIRINKVLRELNISLERAVDYLKDKGIAIEASPNTKISDDVYNILCGQFAGDKGNKEASKGISEEIRKEKEALRIEREKEIEKFDKNLGVLLEEMRENDLLILTADHGNDPTYTGTDHTREYVPFIAYSKRMKNGGAIKDEDTFAVIGASVAENFGVPMPEGTIGHSVLKELM